MKYLSCPIYYFEKCQKNFVSTDTGFESFPNGFYNYKNLRKDELKIDFITLSCKYKVHWTTVLVHVCVVVGST